MSDDDSLLDYLSRDGKLSAPENAPPRYRGELLRLMATFVDSELAGAAGFAETINDGPTVTARIAAALIVMEKLDHAERVLRLFGDFGADTARYVQAHPWAARLPRDADIGASRQGEDMRLNVFHYPIAGWIDAVVMNVLMGRATVIQLSEYTHASYQPFVTAMLDILPREKRHAELGEEGLWTICEQPESRAQAQQSVDYWYRRVAATFGGAGSARYALLRRFGLRHTPNEDLLARWRAETGDTLARLGLTAGR